MSGCQELGKVASGKWSITEYGVFIRGGENFLKLGGGDGCIKP